MSHKWIIFGILLTMSGSLFGEAYISEFHATRQNNAVLLEWATDFESGLKSFEIQRSVDQSSWLKIETVKAVGETTEKNYYRHIDNSVYKPAESSFYYRIVLAYHSGQRVVHDTIVSVSGSSGIRHTWGSIKATFR